MRAVIVGFKLLLLVVSLSASSDTLLEDPDAFFSTFDSDDSGGLDLAEYVDMIRTLEGASQGPRDLSMIDDSDLEDFGDLNERKLEAIWKEVDTSGDGQVDQQEWESHLLARIHESKQSRSDSRPADTNPSRSESVKLSQDPPEPHEGLGGMDQDPLLYAREFDKDGDGKLDQKEFLQFMGEEGDTEDVLAFFKQSDADEDGQLSIDELKKSLLDVVDNTEDKSNVGTADNTEEEHFQAAEDPSEVPIPDDFYKGRSMEIDVDEPDWTEEGEDDVQSQDLYTILEEGTLDELKEAMQNVYSLDGGAQAEDCTPLHEALISWDLWNHNGHLHERSDMNLTAAALLFIEGGADLRHECEGQTSIHLAAQFRNEAVLQSILHEFTDRIKEGVLDSKALQWVSDRADYCPSGGSALHCACYLHNHMIGISKILVGHPGAGHAVASARNKGTCHADERTDLDTSEVHDSFMEWGIDIPREVIRSDATAYYRAELTSALSQWNSRFVNHLLSAGLPPDSTNLDNETALHIAAFSGDLESCKILLQAGSDVTAQNSYGQTPLHRALQAGYSEIADLLMDRMKKSDAALMQQIVRENQERRKVLEQGVRSASILRGKTDKKLGERSTRKPLSGAATGPTSDGGWKRGVLPELEIDYCDIATIDARATNLTEVLQLHERQGMPLLIKGAVRDLDWDFMSVWTREGLTKYGETAGPFKVFRQRNLMKESLQMDIHQFLQEMEAHDPETHPAPDWLVDFGLKEGNPLVDTHNVIVKRFFSHLYKEGLGINNYQFMVAPVQTGASPHFHYTSARLMVYGRARWFLWPLAQAFYSNRDIYDWYMKDYPDLQGAERPLECVQGPGDLMYVPALWGHGVMYMEDTIGMASLFRS